jgi:signal transduction histidine kinase
METALSLHPATRTAFVITGASAHDRFLDAVARHAYGDHEARVRIEYLSGLSIQELLDKVAVLPPDSVVIFLSFLCDAEGEYIYSRDLLRMLAEKSNTPIYSVLSTHLGEGVVGGRLLDFPRAGDEAGKLAVRILRGEPVEAIPMLRENYHAYMFDWRQLRRWAISEGKLPAGSTVLYKEATLFEEYFWYVIGLTLFAITETILLISLMVLNRKQKKTEKMLHLAEGQYREMLRFERISRLGQLITSLAHELKQPLAAILSSAQAALRFLKADKIDLNLFQQILGNIVRDDKRAASVITTLQSMVKKEEKAKEPIILNGVLEDVVAVFMSEAIRSNLTIEKEFDESLPPVLGDAAQLEQVALNLIMNAGDALSQNPPNKKRVVLQTKMTDHAVQVTVRDFGPGIDEARRDELFQPFFTTKKSGMGMGLAICKSIIAEHGGRIWAENHPGGGAVFFFELPVPRNESEEHHHLYH